jgi:cystathionine beta-lyase
MEINFDQIIDRAGTDSAKWETIQSEANAYIHVRTDKFTGEHAAIPMWIADMDFAAPPAVVEAITARAQHPIYGYTELPLTYNRAVADWMRTRHNWTIQPDWIVTTPGVVPALAMLIRALLQPGEKAIIQPPVYYPFKVVLEVNHIEIANNPLIYENGRYRMDVDDLERQARDPRAKLLILSNPHNPVGRVWTRGELTRLAEICRANDVTVISDEIHADLTFAPFTPFGAVDENAIVCTAASKTFNLAGLANSNIILPNPALRKTFENYLLQNALLGAHLFGHIATEAAYTHGADWLDQLLDYLRGTLDFMEEYFAKHLPQIRMIRPEGTYLVWLDCRALGMDSAALTRFFLDRARVYLEDGAIFGTGGEGFLRMNIATPRKVVEEALERMREAINSLAEKK